MCVFAEVGAPIPSPATAGVAAPNAFYCTNMFVKSKKFMGLRKYFCFQCKNLHVTFLFFQTKYFKIC